MSGLRAAAVEWGGFTPLGLNLSLGPEGMVASLLNEAEVSNQLSGVNRKDQVRITPEEAVLIRQFLDVEETNPLAANKVVLDSSRKVLGIIGSGTSHQAVVYQAEADDFKFHPKERYQNRPGSRWVIPVEKFGEALPVPESSNLVEVVVNDFNTAVLDMVAIGAMPLVGAGNIIKSIEPAIRILASKARGEKINLSSEFKTLYETIADESVMEASPVLSKALLGVTAFAVAFGPIASTINLKDLKAFGKAVHGKLELDKGISFNGPNGGPEIPKWAGPISLLVLLIAACQKALDGSPDPKVTIITSIPVPTETPRPATLTPVPSTPTPEIAITPSNGGAGGPEFILGSEVDLQLAVKGEALFPADCTNKIGKDPDYNVFKQLLPGADVKGLVDSLRARLQPDTQRIDSLCIGENGWAIQVLNSNGEILWAKVDGGWFSHPNRILLNGGNITLESVGGARNNKFETRMVILNSQPWVVEFIKGTNYPQRYFNPAENAWREFSWNKFPGSEKLLGNPNLRIVDIKGDFSLNATISTRAQEGGGGGFKVASSDGSKELNVLVNRPPKPNAFVRPQSEVTIQLKDGTKITAGYILPVTTTDSDIIQAKFRLDSNTIEIVFNGKVLKVIPAQGFLAGDKSQLSSGILSGRDGKTAEMELFVSTPNGGQQKGRENVKLSEMIPPTATVAATSKPQFTPVPPATKTLEPSKGPRVLTAAEAQGLLSNFNLLPECLAPHRKGGLPNMVVNGTSYYRKNIASVSGTTITYPDGRTFDVAKAKSVIFWIFKDDNTAGEEIIHVTTNISPQLVVPNLSPGDYAGIDIDSQGNVGGLVVLCYYK